MKVFPPKQALKLCNHFSNGACRAQILNNTCRSNPRNVIKEWTCELLEFHSKLYTNKGVRARRRDRQAADTHPSSPLSLSPKEAVPQDFCHFLFHESSRLINSFATSFVFTRYSSFKFEYFDFAVNFTIWNTFFIG